MEGGRGREIYGRSPKKRASLGPTTMLKTRGTGLGPRERETGPCENVENIKRGGRNKGPGTREKRKSGEK